jgi:hypothetical protein
MVYSHHSGFRLSRMGRRTLCMDARTIYGKAREDIQSCSQPSNLIFGSVRIVSKEIITQTTVCLICPNVLQFGCTAQPFRKFVRPAW